jgi:hypothetical protein
VFIGLKGFVDGEGANMGRLHLRVLGSESFATSIGFLSLIFEYQRFTITIMFSMLLCFLLSLLLFNIAMAQERNKFCTAAKPPLPLPACTVSISLGPAAIVVDFVANTNTRPNVSLGNTWSWMALAPITS